MFADFSLSYARGSKRQDSSPPFFSRPENNLTLLEGEEIPLSPCWSLSQPHSLTTCLYILLHVRLANISLPAAEHMMWVMNCEIQKPQLDNNSRNATQF